MDSQIEAWRQSISREIKWLPQEHFATWVLSYNQERVIVNKMAASVMIEVGHKMTRVLFVDNRTPEGLLELLDREVPQLYVDLIHSD